jgi:hypothetical protein
MRRLNAIVTVFSAVLLAGCQVSGDSTSANDKKGGGGIAGLLTPAAISIPAGTTFALELETAMSSKTSQQGDLVVAKLAEAVRVGEKVVVPAGTEVRGQVTAAAPSGHVKGLARLAFDFDKLVVEGQEHAIATRPIDITAPNTHKKDAVTIGIGAGAGAIVGAIVGGGKGAGIGALVGGAAGTGVMLTNTGKEVELGAGARVTVKLTREVRL